MAVATPVERPRGAARRDAMLRAVLKIVGDTGPEAVTHRRVAEVAGLPLASTTYWFSSKEELLAAALERAANADIARLRHAAEATVDEEPADAVGRAILSQVGEGLRSSRASLVAAYSLWLEAARRPALRALAVRWTDEYHDVVAQLLERSGASDPVTTARLVVAAADGLVMDQLARGGTSDLQPPLRELVIALLDHDRTRPQ